MKFHLKRQICLVHFPNLLPHPVIFQEWSRLAVRRSPTQSRSLGKPISSHFPSLGRWSAQTQNGWRDRNSNHLKEKDRTNRHTQKFSRYGELRHHRVIWERKSKCLSRSSSSAIKESKRASSKDISNSTGRSQNRHRRRNPVPLPISHTSMRMARS